MEPLPDAVPTVGAAQLDKPAVQAPVEPEEQETPNEQKEPDETEAPDAPPSDEEAPALPLAEHIICVDPGHCVTPLTGKGYTELVSPLSDERKALYTTGTQGKNMTEEKLNLTVGLKLRDELEALGATIIMTREVSRHA